MWVVNPGKRSNKFSPQGRPYINFVLTFDSLQTVGWYSAESKKRRTYILSKVFLSFNLRELPTIYLGTSSRQYVTDANFNSTKKYWSTSQPHSTESLFEQRCGEKMSWLVYPPNACHTCYLYESFRVVLRSYASSRSERLEVVEYLMPLSALVSLVQNVHGHIALWNICEEWAISIFWPNHLFHESY